MLIIVDGFERSVCATLAREMTTGLREMHCTAEHLDLATHTGNIGDSSDGMRTHRYCSARAQQAAELAQRLEVFDQFVGPGLQLADTLVVSCGLPWNAEYDLGASHDSVLQALKAVDDLIWQSLPSTLVILGDSYDGERLTSYQLPLWRTSYARDLVVGTQDRVKLRIYRVPEDATLPEMVKDCLEQVAALASSSDNTPKRPKKATPRNHALSPADTTVVYDTYWRFAAERQRIFFRRLENAPAPWTDDPILRQHKFTNAYRAADRVSQYLIRRVIYSGDPSPRETFFRILLFKFFNKIETWELLEQNLGQVSFDSYSYERYDNVLSEAFARGVRIYSAAYIMPSGGGVFDTARKHQMHLLLLEQMMSDELYSKLANTSTMLQGFELLRGYPTIGDFLAYQFITDINYSTLTDYSEMEFVVPGPGARSGIQKCFRTLGGLSEVDVMKVVADRQEEEFHERGIRFESLWGRRLQLIDCQNLFCEVDKYSRIFHPEIQSKSARTRIKQKFRPSLDPLEIWFPPKWGLNEKITSKGVLTARALF